MAQKDEKHEPADSGDPPGEAGRKPEAARGVTRGWGWRRVSSHAGLWRRVWPRTASGGGEISPVGAEEDGEGYGRGGVITG